jgi:hypothetical protein
MCSPIAAMAPSNSCRLNAVMIRRCSIMVCLTTTGESASRLSRTLTARRSSGPSGLKAVSSGQAVAVCILPRKFARSCPRGPAEVNSHLLRMAELLGFSGPIRRHRDYPHDASWRRERDPGQTLSMRHFNRLVSHIIR